MGKIKYFCSILTWKQLLDRNKLDCSVPGKPFQSSLMLEGLAWSIL
jgi:hypothetical protein